METVDIFVCRDGFDHLGSVHMLGQRQLDQNAVHVGIVIEIVDDIQQFLLADIGFKTNDA